MVQAWTVGLFLNLSNDHEKLDLKLCVYKISFGKSGHKYNSSWVGMHAQMKHIL